MWDEAKRLVWKRLGAMTNGNESWLTAERVELLYDDIAEHFDIAAKPRGLEWLKGKCTLEEFEAAQSLI